MSRNFLVFNIKSSFFCYYFSIALVLDLSLCIFLDESSLLQCVEIRLVSCAKLLNHIPTAHLSRDINFNRIDRFKNFPIQDKALFWIYCVIGFVGPTFFVTVTLTADYIEGFYLKPRFGENSCWFGGNVFIFCLVIIGNSTIQFRAFYTSGHSESWAFYYGPIACLLALNMLYFGLTCWRLWYRYRDYNGNGLRSLRFNCLLYVKLFLIMGLTWIFDVISFALMHLGNEMYW